MRIYYSSEMQSLKERLKRAAAADGDIAASVRKIVSDVAQNGDAALFGYTKMYDGFDLSSGNIRVTKDEIEKAYESVSEELSEILKRCAANISAFHNMQKREGRSIQTGGAATGYVMLPVSRAGVYVPGGKAAYPSSVLMNIIPAKIAGVEQIVMVTPPGKDGRIEPLTLAAADMAGADVILKIGGAQAIAALAYGTESVPRADVITGPGNAYVTAAKKEVFGAAGIDMLAGPSEVLIVADGNANPVYVAADLLSQAEHDERSAAILVTSDRRLADSVAVEIERQLALLIRKDIAAKSIEDYGTIVVTESLDEAFGIANEIAPEHLEILTDDPRRDLMKVKNAGAVFLGEYSPEPLGDYFAGPNHVLPTSGTSRFSSPLSVDHFMKRTNYVCYDKKSLAACREDIEAFAAAEGLGAHARSVAVRFIDEVDR